VDVKAPSFLVFDILPGNDSARLLPPMLKGMQSVVGLHRSFGMAKDPKNAAIAAGLAFGVCEFSHEDNVRNY